MCHLRLMNSYEFDRYFKKALVDYAKDIAKSGDSSEEDARREAKKTFTSLLPDGIESKGQYLYHIINDTEAVVGIIWLGLATNDLGFIYDFSIYETFREQGFGAQTIKLIENKAKEFGLKKISLRVFGHNIIAMGLYKKMGYQIDSMNMSKEIK